MFFSLHWQLSGSGIFPWNIHGLFSIRSFVGNNILLCANFVDKIVVNLIVVWRLLSVFSSLFDKIVVVFITLFSVTLSICPNQVIYFFDNVWKTIVYIHLFGGIHSGLSPFLQSIFLDKSHRLWSTSYVILFPHLRYLKIGYSFLRTK